MGQARIREAIARARMRSEESGIEKTGYYSFIIYNMEQEKKKSVWGVIIKVIIAVATALAGTLGLTACGVW